MWSCLIEILHIGMQDTMELLLMEDHYVVQALSPNTPQKAFTDHIGARRVIGPALRKEPRSRKADRCGTVLGI